MGNKRILAGIAAVALCFALALFARDWFDPIDSLWNPTKGCFPPDEQFDRGMMFLERRHFKERNRRKAEWWLRTSALQGYAEAQFKLGTLLLESPLADAAEARGWLEKAAAQGHGGARIRIAGIERKEREAEAATNAKTKAEAEERARKVAEAKAKAEAEAAASAKARAEAEERARLASEAKAKAEAEAAASAKARAEAEERARLAAEARAKAEAQAAAEARAKAETERKAREAVLAKGTGKNAGDRKSMNVGQRSLAFRWCPAGSFMMGSPSTEEGRYNDETQHRVTLSHGFWMGETEVTQGLWKEVMGETVLDLCRKALQDDTLYDLGGKKQTIRDYWGDSRDTNPVDRCADPNDDVPAYYVNWFDAKRFCERLEDRLRASGTLPEGYGIRLPTEAEWEYACRAGTTASLPNGKDIKILGENNAPALDGIAWYGGNASVGFEGRGWDTENWKEKQYPGGRAAPRKVGTKAANAWGLYDMIGNVWEWCSDWYGNYPGGAQTDPKGPSSGSGRVDHGGSWVNDARFCRSAYRGWHEPGCRSKGLGLRVVLARVQ